MFDFLYFFKLFSVHDVHDFLRLPVGVVWCFRFNCKVPSVGRAFPWCHSPSVYFACERAIRPGTDPLSLLCHGLDSHERSSHLSLSRRRLALSILGNEQTPTFTPHQRLASCRIQNSSFRVQVKLGPSSRGMPRRHHCPARRRIEPELDLSVVSSDLTPAVQLTRCCGRSTCNAYNFSSYSTTRLLGLIPSYVLVVAPTSLPNSVTTCQLALDPTLFQVV